MIDKKYTQLHRAVYIVAGIKLSGIGIAIIFFGIYRGLNLPIVGGAFLLAIGVLCFIRRVKMNKTENNSDDRTKQTH